MAHTTAMAGRTEVVPACHMAESRLALQRLWLGKGPVEFIDELPAKVLGEKEKPAVPVCGHDSKAVTWWQLQE